MILDAQGYLKTNNTIPKGLIIAFYGPRVPEGWAICNGTNGTPDLTDRFLVGDTAVGTGTAAGTESAVTGLVHSGFALAAHSAHAVTQPSAHSAHSVTQPAAHSAHTATQPSTHSAHASQGAHTHDNHTGANTGSGQVIGTKLSGAPLTHASQGGHTHDAHPAHTAFAVDAHSAHAGLAVDAHSAHAGLAVDAHSAHSMTQAGNHLYKVYRLCYIFKL